MIRVALFVAAIGLAVTLFELIASPTLRRLALRNISRRRGEAALIIVGSMFGTAVIGAALIVGDSFDGSIRDVARTDLGPIDLTVIIHGVDGDVRRTVLQLEDRIAHSGIDHIDGLLPMVKAAAVLDNRRRDGGQRIDPSNCLAEIDFAQGRRFGPNDAIGGLVDAGSTPTAGQAVVPDPLASPTAAPTTSGTPRSTPAPIKPSATVPPVAPPATPAEPAPTVVARTWNVAGGQVSAECRGAAIVLLSATPENAWSVEVKHSGPTEIEVKLRRGEEETSVHASCVAGVPEMTAEAENEHD